MKILIKYATKGRPELFKRSIKNILNTITTKEFLILVSADENDPTMQTPDIIEFIQKETFNVKMLFGKSKSKIDAINRDVDQVQDWDILVNTSDDMYFIIPGWNEILCQDVQKEWGIGNTDWFAHYDDGFVGSALPTMSIMGRAYYEKDGYVYHPDYKSFSSDAEAMYVAMMRKKYKYFGDGRILAKHLHPANDKKVENDQVYKENSLATQDDLKVYWKRLNNFFYEKEFDRPVPFEEHLGKNKHLYE